MKIRRFFGKDMRDALKQVKDELGGDAVIMSNKKSADGVEIVAAYDKEMPANNSAASADPQASVKKTPTLSEIIGDSGPDSLRALLEKQSKTAQNKEVQSVERAAPLQGSDGFQNRRESTATSRRESAPVRPESAEQPALASDLASMDEIKQELKSLRNVLEFQVSGLLKQESRRTHPLHGYLITRLEEMGIKSELAEEVVSYAPEEADERQAWLFLLKLLANRLHTTGNTILTQTGVVALVGPTGTGKTTTIAKLAARYAQKYGPDQVALVTIDTYRIAAFEQLSTYGKIIGCTVKKAQTESELGDILHQLRSKRLVLIDSAGFGQRDSRLINQLDTLNQHSCANIKKYLVMQANAQYQVMERTIRAYNSISLQGCIFTKLDECYSLGEAVSAAIVHGLAISYLTDGQKVPEDLKVADAKYLISSAAKLYKKYALPHTTNKQVASSALAV